MLSIAVLIELPSKTDKPPVPDGEDEEIPDLLIGTTSLQPLVPAIIHTPGDTISKEALGEKEVKVADEQLDHSQLRRAGWIKTENGKWGIEGL